MFSPCCCRVFKIKVGGYYSYYSHHRIHVLCVLNVVITLAGVYKQEIEQNRNAIGAVMIVVVAVS